MKNKGSNSAKRQYVTGHWLGWETWGGGGVGREFDMRMNLKSLKTFSHANPWKKYYSRSNKHNNKKKSYVSY